MERFFLVEHVVQNPEENAANSAEKSGQKPRKVGRSQADKVGKHKYELQRLDRVDRRLAHIEEMQQIILNGLKGAGYFHFDVPVLQRLACESQLDVDILELVHQAGRSGVLPRDVAAALSVYKDQKGHPIKQYHVTRSIQRMNRRLGKRSGERLFEKRGLRWGLTQFGFESYGDVNKGSLEEFSVETEDEEK